MPIKYSIDEDANLMHLTAHGETTNKEWMDIFLQIKRDPKRRTNTSYLLDYSKHLSPVSFEYMLAIAKRVEPRESPLKWAFILERGMSDENVQRFRAILGPKNIVIESFSDIESGKKWLME